MKPRSAPDLDTQILHAEHAVMRRDQHLRNEVDALTRDLREHAARLALIGIVGVSTLAVGAWLLTRPRALPGPGAAPARTTASVAPPTAAPPTASGSFAQSALGSPGRPGWVSPLLSLALPLLSRWWRERPPPAH